MLYFSQSITIRHTLSIVIIDYLIFQVKIYMHSKRIYKKKSKIIILHHNEPLSEKLNKRLRQVLLFAMLFVGET